MVCVGTPVINGKPNLDDLNELLVELVKYANPNSSIVLRSTLPVGYSTFLQSQISDLNSTLKISFAPERTVEGNALTELHILPQIIATPIFEEYTKISKIFSILGCETIHIDKFEEAEFGKLVSNIWRDFTFSFSNELFWIAKAKNINFSNVVRIFNHNYPRNQIPKHGPVSGPCLSKDIFIFNASTQEFNLGTVARRTNKEYIVKYLNKIILENKIKDNTELRIGIYGLAFKGSPPTSDYRSSHTLDIIEKLAQFSQLKISIYDPEIKKLSEGFKNISFSSKAQVLHDSDVIIITSNHTEFTDANFHAQINQEQLSRNLKVYDLWSGN
jgi:UDP-N-acetyl-D-mannosaminuronic acid dehydrogenase